MIFICAHAPCARPVQCSSIAIVWMREFKIKGGKDAKIQGVLAKRNPMLPYRLSDMTPPRLAERNLAGLLLQEPPRITR